MTSSDYTITCVARGAQFIADQIQAGATPTLQDIAAAANLSRHHFHRLYRLVTGETCAQTITRLRLARGASTLDGTTGSVTSAALDAGYGSSQAFAKALRRATGASAGALAQETDRLAQAIEQFAVPSPSDGDRDVIVELVALKPFTVTVKQTRGQYPNLNQTYWDLFSAMPDPSTVRAILGWPLNDIDLADPAFDCGLFVEAAPEKLPQDITTRQEDGGTFLRTRHTGAYRGLSATLDAAYTAALQGGHALADRSCLFHYLDDPEETAEPALRTDLYVPLA